MPTVTISQETADFLSELSREMNTQDNRGTQRPIYFAVCKKIDVAVPDGCGDRFEYFDSQMCDSRSEDEAKEYAESIGIPFEEYVARCHKYEVREEERFENFFLTQSGYDRHVKLDWHNIARNCKSYSSYVMPVRRNPEINRLVFAIHEIAAAIPKDE